MNFKITETDIIKSCKAIGSYSYYFNKATGLFIRHGKTAKREDDPTYSPGPEILDIEISSGSACTGNCPFCYKDNQPGGNRPLHNMTLDQFKTILGKMPKDGKSHLLSQIAVGIMDIGTNPDFIPMMEYAREQGIVPNFTTNGKGVTEEFAQRVSKICGAVAVSVTNNRDQAFDAVKKFTDAGMEEVNLHYLLSQQTGPESIFKAIKEDPRLSGIRAVVFLGYKPKGVGKEKFSPVKDLSVIKGIVDYATKNKLSIGFDSCTAPSVLLAYKGTEMEEIAKNLIEPCEAGCFSSYISAEGKYYPCSFTEGTKDWEDGINVLECFDFVKDVWESQRNLAWRTKLLGSTSKCTCDMKLLCRACPVYDITPCLKDKKENRNRFFGKNISEAIQIIKGKYS
jgi:MoaA/NifB/PqqE/SkfB family radical SAM enzyme